MFWKNHRDVPRFHRWHWFLAALLLLLGNSNETRHLNRWIKSEHLRTRRPTILILLEVPRRCLIDVFVVVPIVPPNRSIHRLLLRFDTPNAMIFAFVLSLLLLPTTSIDFLPNLYLSTISHVHVVERLCRN